MILINRWVGSGNPTSLGFLERFRALPVRTGARNNSAAPSALLVFVPEGVAREGKGVLDQYHFERKLSRLSFQSLRKSLPFC